jgi:putative transcription antitermination factor YqgF
MKYLGIDYGEKRVGIAISDEEGRVAFPKTVLENNLNLKSNILDLCKEHNIDAVVIGESKNYKGEDNKINPEIISFKRELGAELKIPISLEPEFMTSMQVEKNFGKTEMLDASAASIILQTFMDKEKNRKEKIQKQKAEEEKKKDETKSEGGKINYDDFKKIEMKIGKILSAEPVDGSDKLYKLSVDFAEGEPRQILSGIAKFFPDSKILVGKKVAFVTNLEPKPLMGMQSNGMILAVKSEENLALMEVPDFIKEGSTLS